ncbi:MAG: tetratricopeptide repeat protein [Candidatus Pseudobacter hemicellulosilyticus]|uniref:Tetratricopeptide repeat protein n=1 Tax=Candidatus Pseudobacter hemicellulosilyticus TaxID=3121375 RepID=A0AAJ5WM31_9BACT|nr:MAG: tetratricopeptide repeat protein [Pseudobacter sp.]
MVEVEALLHRAHLLLEQGRPRDAEKQLADALQQDPENDQAIGLLARCKYDLRQFQEGIRLAQQAVRLSPMVSYYFYLLAFGYFQTDNYPAARQSLGKAIELNPHAADYFGLWSLVLLEEKNFSAALEKANEGLAVDAQNITCLNARATALNKLRRVEDAIETMATALERDPENAYTHSSIGWNLLEKGRHREAATHFRESLRLEPMMEGSRAGLKQSLKSKIAPYRWLLQYSFWINNKGKNARWMIPLGVYVGVQAIYRATDKAGSNWSALGAVVIGLYILLAATTWIINPVANFFLLFHKDGKYALTSSERWSALLTMSALAGGLIIALSGLLAGEAGFPWLISGILLFSLAIPLGQLEFPLLSRARHWTQWLSRGVLLAGLLAIVLTFIGNYAEVWIGYAVLFVAYTWVSALAPR